MRVLSLMGIVFMLARARGDDDICPNDSWGAWSTCSGCDRYRTRKCSLDETIVDQGSRCLIGKIKYLYVKILKSPLFCQCMEKDWEYVFMGRGKISGKILVEVNFLITLSNTLKHIPHRLFSR